MGGSGFSEAAELKGLVEAFRSSLAATAVPLAEAWARASGDGKGAARALDAGYPLSESFDEAVSDLVAWAGDAAAALGELAEGRDAGA